MSSCIFIICNMRSGFFSNINFIITFVSLKFRNLLWINRWKKIGMLVLVGPLLLALYLQVPRDSTFGALRFIAPRGLSLRFILFHCIILHYFAS